MPAKICGMFAILRCWGFRWIVLHRGQVCIYSFAMTRKKPKTCLPQLWKLGVCVLCFLKEKASRDSRELEILGLLTPTEVAHSPWCNNPLTLSDRKRTFCLCAVGSISSFGGSCCNARLGRFVCTRILDHRVVLAPPHVGTTHSDLAL